MSTTTIPTRIERTGSTLTHGVSHLTPLLLAVVLLAMTAAISVLISGPIR